MLSCSSILQNKKLDIKYIPLPWAQKSLWLTATPPRLDEEKCFTATNFNDLFNSNEKQNEYQFIHAERNFNTKRRSSVRWTDLSVKVCKIFSCRRDSIKAPLVVKWCLGLSSSLYINAFHSSMILCESRPRKLHASWWFQHGVQFRLTCRSYGRSVDLDKLLKRIFSIVFLFLF